MFAGIDSKFTENFASISDIKNDFMEVGLSEDDAIRKIKKIESFQNNLSSNIKNNNTSSKMNKNSSLNPPGVRNNSKNNMYPMRGNLPIPPDYEGLEEDEFELTREITSDMSRNNIETSDPMSSSRNPKPTIKNSLNKRRNNSNNKRNEKFQDIKTNNKMGGSLGGSEYDELSSPMEMVEKVAERDYEETMPTESESNMEMTEPESAALEEEIVEEPAVSEEDIEEPFVGSSMSGKQFLKTILLALLITLFVYVILSKEVFTYVRKLASMIPHVSLEMVHYAIIFLVIYLCLVIFA